MADPQSTLPLTHSNGNGQGKSHKLDMEDVQTKRPPSKIPMIALVVVILIAIALAIALGVVVSQNNAANQAVVDNSNTDGQSQGTDSPTTSAKPSDPEGEICMTPGCVQASAALMNAMDTSVDPCDDFFMYSCGGWLKKNLVPEDKSSYSTFTKLRDELLANLKALMEDKSATSEPRAVTEAKNMYQACMNVDLIDQRGVEPLLDLYDHLGGWPMVNSTWDPNSFDLMYTLSELRLLNNRYLVDIWVSADDRNSTVNIVQLDQFGLGMGNRDYFLETQYAERMAAYKTFITDTALYLNGTAATVEQDVNDLIEFEIYLANITVPKEERRDAVALYRRYKVSELYTNISSGFDWLVYLNKIFDSVDYEFTNDTEVVVYSPVFLKKMVEKLQTTPNRVVANYLLWRITAYRISNLPQSMQDIESKFKEVFYGISAEPPRWQKCISYVNSFIGFAVGRLFVNEYFNEASKASALEMIAGVRSSFDGLLETVEWMDDETRAVAKQKSAAISEKIGYPDWINNDTRLNEEYKGIIGKIDGDKYFENYLVGIRHSAIQKFEDINKPIDKNKWSTVPAIVNAFYSSSKNQISFPGGVLQPPFWSADRPESMNYGGIGMVIGHEITHGFDDQGRQFDKDGNLVEWWNQDVTEAFTDKAQCIIDQYGNYVMPQINRTLNGVNTQGENIADNGGIKQAFNAYKAYEEKHGPGQRLPGLETFNSKKLFFMAFGQIWCSAYKDAGLDNAITTGVHSPGMYRVIGTLSNFEEFSNVFQCPAGSRMNPTDRCSVW